ncbi:MAG: nucleoside 2-deoxyribosyltransferase [Anaerolineae bacterium]|nr:nucleoside 2-deoxyribosyltransferase [Anaerolineae bacterium]
MKQAYLGIKFYADQRNRPLIEMITAVLTQAGWTTQVIVRDVEQWGAVQLTPQALMARTFAVIEASDMAVIDLTEKGVGLGIEAGYAFAKGIPVMTIARAGSDISTTLRGISKAVCLYRNEADLVACFRERLAL